MTNENTISTSQEMSELATVEHSVKNLFNSLKEIESVVEDIQMSLNDPIGGGPKQKEIESACRAVGDTRLKELDNQISIDCNDNLSFPILGRLNAIKGRLRHK